MDLTATNATTMATAPISTSSSSSSGFSTNEIILAVGVFILMVGVGASCELKLLKKIMYSPKARWAALVGLACQFLIMPLIAYLLTLVFQVDNKWTSLGFILVGCMPGGSTSNVFALYGKGVLELSVFMTIVSTIMAFGMTPLWLFVYGQAIGLDGSTFPFQPIAMTFALLIIPLSLGFLLTYCAPRAKPFIEKVLAFLALAVFALVLVLLFVEYHEAVTAATPTIYVAAMIYFPIASSVSYGLATLCQLKPALKRTIVVEVGIQNLSLAFAIGQLIAPTDEEIGLGLPFCLLYTVFMYVWAGLLLPLFRWQSRRNIQAGIVDSDPDLLLLDDDDDNNKVEEKESSNSGDNNNNINIAHSPPVVDVESTAEQTPTNQERDSPQMDAV